MRVLETRARGRVGLRAIAAPRWRGNCRLWRFGHREQPAPDLRGRGREVNRGEADAVPNIVASEPVRAKLPGVRWLCRHPQAPQRFASSRHLCASSRR